MRNPDENIARGATEVFAGIIKVADELKIDGKEFKIDRIELNGDLRTDILNGDKKRIAGREYDFTVLVDGKLIKYEMKSWDPEAIKYYLSSSLTGKLAKGNDEIVGQFRNDLVSVLNETMDASGKVNLKNIAIRWRFDGRADAAGITTDEIYNIIETVLLKDDNAKKFIDTLKHKRFLGKNGGTKFEEFVNGNLKAIVDEMFEIRGTP